MNISISILLIFIVVSLAINDTFAQRRFSNGWEVRTIYPGTVYNNLNTLSDDFCSFIQTNANRYKNSDFQSEVKEDAKTWIGKVSLEDGIDYFQENDHEIVIQYRYYKSLSECYLGKSLNDFGSQIELENNALVTAEDGKFRIEIPVRELENDIILDMINPNQSQYFFDEYDLEMDLYVRFRGNYIHDGVLQMSAEYAQLTHHSYGIIWESYYY